MFFKKKNSRLTSTKTIIEQMNERRPLPMGRKEFEEWSDRIIAGAMIPGVTAESVKFSLADQLLHLGPTESHKEDAFFIHVLRKCAVNQVADEMRKEIRERVKARLAEDTLKLETQLAPNVQAAKEEAERRIAANPKETHAKANSPEVLANRKV